MLAYVLRRAAWAVMLCVIVSLFTFVIFYLARAEGMSEWGVLRRHALPNAFIPVIPMVAMDISRFALPTALFVETAFGLPGLGQTLRNALARNDLPVIVGAVVVSALVIAIVDFVGEVIQAMIDPRVRLQPAPAS